MYGFQPEPEPPQEIIVEGTRWTSGWTTLCFGDACTDVIAEMRAGQRGTTHNWIGEAYIRYHDIREHKADACSELAKIPDETAKRSVANTTSLSASDARREAAKALLPVSSAFHNALQTVTTVWGTIAYGMNNGFEVEITFSDGGKETYFMVITANSTGVIPDEQGVKAGSHQPGDGSSKCPRAGP